MAGAVLGAVNDHAEAAVDHLAPAHAAAVVDAHPRGAAEAVPDDVLHGHIGTETGAVINVGGFAEGGVCSGNVVMVAAQHDGGRYFAFADGFVEGEGNPGAAFAVCVEDAGLGTHHQVVAAGFLNPVDVVAHLAGNLFRRAGGNLREYFHGQLVRLLQVFRLFAHAHPAERAKTVVKVERPHDVLHIGRVAEGAVGLEDIGPGAGTFQEEGVAVVKEVHAFGRKLVDGGYVAAEGGLHRLFEAFRLLGHQAFALFQAVAHRVVAAGPGVVQAQGLCREVWSLPRSTCTFSAARRSHRSTTLPT